MSYLAEEADLFNLKEAVEKAVRLKTDADRKAFAAADARYKADDAMRELNRMIGETTYRDQDGSTIYPFVELAITWTGTSGEMFTLVTEEAEIEVMAESINIDD